MPVEIRWHGDKVIRDTVKALGSGVDDSTKQIYDDWQKTISVDTGRSKAEMLIVPAKEDGDEVFSMVLVPVSYAVFNELETKAGRRAMMKNEKSSLRNFKGRLK